MAIHIEQLQQHLLKIYNQNPFVGLLEMKLVGVEAGRTTIRMPIRQEKHTNLYGMAHGGALASLADTVMGVACATMGNRVVTIDMNINYIKGAQAQCDVIAVGCVLHHGNSTMVAEADLLNEEGILLAKSRGTFYVVGQIELNSDVKET